MLATPEDNTAPDRRRHFMQPAGFNLLPRDEAIDTAAHADAMVSNDLDQDHEAELAREFMEQGLDLDRPDCRMTPALLSRLMACVTCVMWPSTKRKLPKKFRVQLEVCESENHIRDTFFQCCAVLQQNTASAPPNVAAHEAWASICRRKALIEQALNDTSPSQHGKPGIATDMQPAGPALQRCSSLSSTRHTWGKLWRSAAFQLHTKFERLLVLHETPHLTHDAELRECTDKQSRARLPHQSFLRISSLLAESALATAPETRSRRRQLAQARAASSKRSVAKGLLTLRDAGHAAMEQDDTDTADNGHTIVGSSVCTDRPIKRQRSVGTDASTEDGQASTSNAQGGVEQPDGPAALEMPVAYRQCSGDTHEAAQVLASLCSAHHGLPVSPTSVCDDSLSAGALLAPEETFRRILVAVFRNLELNKEYFGYHEGDVHRIGQKVWGRDEPLRRLSELVHPIMANRALSPHSISGCSVDSDVQPSMGLSELQLSDSARPQSKRQCQEYRGVDGATRPMTTMALQWRNNLQASSSTGFVTPLLPTDDFCVIGGYAVWGQRGAVNQRRAAVTASGTRMEQRASDSGMRAQPIPDRTNGFSRGFRSQPMMQNRPKYHAYAVPGIRAEPAAMVHSGSFFPQEARPQGFRGAPRTAVDPFRPTEVVLPISPEDLQC